MPSGGVSGRRTTSVIWVACVPSSDELVDGRAAALGVQGLLPGGGCRILARQATGLVN